MVIYKFTTGGTLITHYELHIMTAQNTSFSAVAELLIRKPVSEVFEAFTNPEITTRFWFTKSTGKLEAGKEVKWIWEMYNHTVPVTVKSLEPEKSIVIEWGNGGEMTTVEWTFKPYGDNTTFVSIVNSGFKGDHEQITKGVRGSTEGFTLVLAGLKALLEFDIELNLIRDRFPEDK